MEFLAGRTSFVVRTAPFEDRGKRRLPLRAATAGRHAVVGSNDNENDYDHESVKYMVNVYIVSW